MRSYAPYGRTLPHPRPLRTGASLRRRQAHGPRFVRARALPGSVAAPATRLVAHARCEPGRADWGQLVDRVARPQHPRIRPSVQAAPKHPLQRPRHADQHNLGQLAPRGARRTLAALALVAERDQAPRGSDALYDAKAQSARRRRRTESHAASGTIWLEAGAFAFTGGGMIPLFSQ